MITLLLWVVTKTRNGMERNTEWNGTWNGNWNKFWNMERNRECELEQNKYETWNRNRTGTVD